jgi:hypothetical protein
MLSAARKGEPRAGLFVDGETTESSEDIWGRRQQRTAPILLALYWH